MFKDAWWPLLLCGAGVLGIMLGHIAITPLYGDLANNLDSIEKLYGAPETILVNGRIETIDEKNNIVVLDAQSPFQWGEHSLLRIALTSDKAASFQKGKVLAVQVFRQPGPLRASAAYELPPL